MTLFTFALQVTDTHQSKYFHASLVSTLNKNKTHQTILSPTEVNRPPAAQWHRPATGVSTNTGVY